MNSSTYYAGKIAEFETVKANVSGLFGSLDSCADAVSKASGYAKELVISGKTFDNGKCEQLSNSLSSVRGDLKSIVSECDTKIQEYTNLYNAAVAREKKEAEKNSV